MWCARKQLNPLKCVSPCTPHIGGGGEMQNSNTGVQSTEKHSYVARPSQRFERIPRKRNKSARTRLGCGDGAMRVVQNSLNCGLHRDQAASIPSAGRVLAVPPSQACEVLRNECLHTFLQVLLEQLDAANRLRPSAQLVLHWYQGPYRAFDQWVHGAAVETIY